MVLSSFPALLRVVATAAGLAVSAPSVAEAPTAEVAWQLRAALEARAPLPVGPAQLPTLAMLSPGQTLQKADALRERALKVREAAAARGVDSAKKAVGKERAASVNKGQQGNARRSAEATEPPAGQSRAKKVKKEGPLRGKPQRP